MIRQLTVSQKIGYGVGDAACGIVFSSVTMFLTYFYTDIYGLSAAAVGTMFLVTRVFDAVTDPLTGILADRTNTRWGHFRPWLIWFAIPYAVLAVMAFTTPEMGDTGKLVYAYVTYSLLMLCYTFINIPYCALGGVISSDEKQRLSAQSYRFAISSVSGLFVSICTLYLVDHLGGGNKQLGFQYTAGIMGTLAVIMLFYCFFSTREELRPEVTEKPASIKSDFKNLIANDQWRLVAVITFFSSMASVMRSAATMYYATYLMTEGFTGDATGMKSAFITTSVIGTIFGPMLANHLGKKYCSVFLFRASCLVLTALGVVMFLVPPTYLYVVFPLFFCIGFFHQGYQPFKWNMMANAADYGEWKTGQRITGLSYSGNLFCLKMGMAVAGALVGFILGAIGYQAGEAHQIPSAVTGIVALLTVGPSISYFILYLLSKFYILDEDMMTRIQKDLLARKNKQTSVESGSVTTEQEDPILATSR
ncbi:MAG: glycoside-pentoside-hexuronide (GPH):cation symporter [Vibrio sp.]